MQPETCKITYLGFSEPKSNKEVEFEILGLKNLIAKANQRITALEQAIKLAEISSENNKEKK